MKIEIEKQKPKRINIYFICQEGEMTKKKRANDCWIKSYHHKPICVTSYGRGHGHISRETIKG